MLNFELRNCKRSNFFYKQELYMQAMDFNCGFRVGVGMEILTGLSSLRAYGDLSGLSAGMRKFSIRNPEF